MFQSVLYKVHEHTDVFVDGGLLCNYPIHAFDGRCFKMRNSSETSYLFINNENEVRRPTEASFLKVQTTD